MVDVGGDEVRDVGVDGDGGVEAGDVAAGGFGLGECEECVLLVEEDLALEVGGLDEVAVDKGEGADSGAGEERGGGGSGGSDADDGDVSGGEVLLAGGADAGEEDLARVPGFIGEGYGSSVRANREVFWGAGSWIRGLGHGGVRCGKGGRSSVVYGKAIRSVERQTRWPFWHPKKIRERPGLETD